MRHFSELTQEEITEFQERVITAAVIYATEINVSGLSHNGVHNIYESLRFAVLSEWENSKMIMNQFIRGNENE